MYKFACVLHPIRCDKFVIMNTNIFLLLLSSSAFLSFVIQPADREGSGSYEILIESDVESLNANELEESQLLEVMDELMQIEDKEIEVLLLIWWIFSKKLCSDHWQ